LKVNCLQHCNQQYWWLLLQK